MGWSTNDPLGGGSYPTDSTNFNNSDTNNFKLSAGVGSIRGTGNTYYIKFYIKVTKFSGSSAPDPLDVTYKLTIGGTDYTYPWNHPGTGTFTVYYSGTGGSSNSALSYSWTATIHKNPSGSTSTSGSASIPRISTAYNIVYNGNNATGGSTAAQTKYYDKTITISSNGFTKEGHTFSKWNTKADGTGNDYTPGQTYSTQASITLYAQWTPNTYAVTYNSNGGSGTVEPQTKTYGIDLILQNNSFTKARYNFVEWNTASDGTGIAYLAGATYTDNAAVTLYAQWEKAVLPIYINMDGDLKEISNIYVNDNNIIKECTAYIKTDNTIKQIV